MIHPKKYLFLWPFFILLPILLNAQSAEKQLKQGSVYLQLGELDSARFVFQKAYEKDDPGIQLEAVTGLVKVAIRQTEMEVADSLIRIGDGLFEKMSLASTESLKYQTTKAEYFRKNSRLEEALALHQKVIKATENHEDRRLYANALFYTGLTYEGLTFYDSSLYYVEKAYPIFVEELDSTDLAFSAIYNGMAICYHRSNQLEKAKSFYLKSKNFAEKYVGLVSTDLAICLNNLSVISRTEENYPEAIDFSQQALKIYNALGDEQGKSAAYYALGIYHFFMGDYGRTRDYIQACIDIRERLFSKSHYSLIGPNELMGITYEAAGDVEQTLFYLRQVRKNIRSNYGEGSLPEAFNAENTAISFQRLGRLDSALVYIQIATEILPDRLPENDYSLSVHYFSYANILYHAGDYSGALEKLRLSNEICQARSLEYSSEYAQNLALQGLINAALKNWALADEFFADALEIIRMPGEKEGGQEAFKMIPNTLAILNDYTDYLYRRYQSAPEPANLNAYEKYSRIYLEHSDRFRKQFMDPYTKSVLVRNNTEVYDRNIGIYHQLYSTSRSEDYLSAVYEFSEYGKAALLRDLQDEKIISYAGVPDSLVERELQLKKLITSLNENLLEYPDSSAVRDELLQQKEALNQHIELTSQSYPRYFDLKFRQSVPELKTLQSALKQGENLVEYMQDDTTYYALVINTSTVDLFKLGSRKVVDGLIRSWRTGIASVSEQEVREVSGQLYTKLWQPIEAALEGEKVTIVPVGPLFYLNFETLSSQESPETFLIESYNIAYGLSLSLLFFENSFPREGKVMAIAPGFEPDIKEAYLQQLDSMELPDEAFLQTIRQPWSLRLADHIRRSYPHATFTGLAATESNIKASLSEGSLLYFGTHAIANPADPLRSKLILAKETGEQTEDGYLHAYEIYGLDLNAELAVLSACESGLGQLQKGEGMISLAYGIHYAGCPSTVMSLWKVDEKVNTEITKKFLEHLSNGLTKSEALRQAKLDYLQTAKGNLRSPFYWGGMVLMGKDGTVALDKGFPWWWLVVAGVVLLGGALWYRRNQSPSNA